MVKVCEKAIIEQNRSKDYLGNVFIDEEMKNYMVPFSQRSASTATKTLVRGSRVKIPDNAKAAEDSSGGLTPSMKELTSTCLHLSMTRIGDSYSM
jgi:hypothetical protein